MKNEWATGRPAEVGDLLNVVGDHRDVARVVEAMREDLLAHPGEWENPTLGRYLDALAAVLDSLAARFANQGETTSDAPSWKLIADVLVAATHYE